MRREKWPHVRISARVQILCQSIFFTAWTSLSSCGSPPQSDSKLITVKSNQPLKPQKSMVQDPSLPQSKKPTKHAFPPSTAPVATQAQPKTPKVLLSPQLSKVLRANKQPSLTLIMDLESKKILGQAQHGFDNEQIIEQLRWAPASTVKPLLAWHALSDGSWSTTQEVDCKGTKPDASKRFCFARHNTIDLATAIATSCNHYFFALVDRIGRSGVIQSFGKMGFNTKAIDESKWQASAIGHGSLLVSPLQVAAAYRQLALALQNSPKLLPIRKGLERAVHDHQGSANRAATSSVKLMGKTGTHSSGSSEKSEQTQWFVAFAPMDKPQIVVVSLVENKQSSKNKAVALAVKSVEAWQSTQR